MSRRAGIDERDATPEQITTFQERVKVFNRSKELARALAPARAISRAIVRAMAEQGEWPDDPPPPGLLMYPDQV